MSGQNTVSQMQEFAHRANIERYKRILQTSLTDHERAFIQKRLAEERSSLAELCGNDLKPLRRDPTKCPSCRTVLSLPECSQSLSENETTHLWSCTACGRVFESKDDVAEREPSSSELAEEFLPKRIKSCLNCRTSTTKPATSPLRR